MFSTSRQRSRAGCRTCRRRKKKCDNTSVPCNNCAKLGIQCDRNVELVWEDDTRRKGMARRGPARSKTNTAGQHPKRMRDTQDSEGHADAASSRAQMRVTDVEAIYSITVPSPQSSYLSHWPFTLDSTESMLLDHYIQRFSRTYPAFSGPNNPFLRVILPLSLQSRAVLDSLLALGGVQSWSNRRFTFEHAMLKLRQKALRGCRKLIDELYLPASQPVGTALLSSEPIPILKELAVTQRKEPKILHLLASCVLLLLYEKLSGEKVENGTTHLHFLSRILSANVLSQVICTAAQGEAPCTSENEAFRFIANLFVYNDFIRSTSLRTLSFSDFYLCTAFHGHALSLDDAQHRGIRTQHGTRLTFPGLMARTAAGDLSVTDADIADWDGDLGWLPSFSLVPAVHQEPYERLPITDADVVFDASFRPLSTVICPVEWKEERIISEVYRITGIIYRRQCLAQLGLNDGDSRDGQTGNLPSWAVQLINSLPEKSTLENTLLWPIGIIAKELDDDHEMEREIVLGRLEALETRFHMKHFGEVREHLRGYWGGNGRVYEDGATLFG